jgi:hypothetical protein
LRHCQSHWPAWHSISSSSSSSGPLMSPKAWGLRG